jgi:hypothetical protein
LARGPDSGLLAGLPFLEKEQYNKVSQFLLEGPSMTDRYRTLIFLALLCALSLQELPAQPAFAGGKRELRGVWIASVMNYDWPVSPLLTPQ